MKGTWKTVALGSWIVVAILPALAGGTGLDRELAPVLLRELEKMVTVEAPRGPLAHPTNCTVALEARRTARLMAHLLLERLTRACREDIDSCRRELEDPRWRDAGLVIDDWVAKNPLDRTPHFREMFLYHYPRELLASYVEAVERGLSAHQEPRSRGPTPKAVSRFRSP